jgi:hypothetical protein
MRRATKILLMGSFLALIVCVLSGCGQRQVEKIKQEPLIVLPADATIVGGMELGQLNREAPFFKQDEVKKLIEEIEAKTKLDVFKDLDRIVFGISNVGKSAPPSIAVFQGRFNPAEVTKTLKEQIPESTFEDKTFNSYKYTVVDTRGGPHMSISFGFPVSEFAVLSTDEQALKTALARFTKPAKSVMDNSDMASLVAKIDRTSNLWVAGLVPENVREKMKDNPQTSALEKLTQFSMTLKCIKGVDLEIAGYCSSPDEASGVKDAITTTLDQIKPVIAFVPQGEQLLNFVNKIEVSAEESIAKMKFVLTEEEVNKLMEMAEQMKEPMGPPAPMEPAQPFETPEPEPTETP